MSDSQNLSNEFSTPMMQQYLRIKEKYADCLLLYRLGDFYEMFLEDAKEGAEILDITLTTRARGRDGKIPMAGVPYHALDNYLFKLVQAGKKVAICEQMTEPGKGLVERDVIRIVTPGTVLDEKNLDKKEHLYVLFLAFGKLSIAAAAADVGTGEVLVSEVPIKLFRTAAKSKNAKDSFDQEEYVAAVKASLQELATLLHPAEVVVSPTVRQTKSLYRMCEQTFTYVTSDPNWPSTLDSCRETVTQQFGPASVADPLLRTDLIIQSLAALIQYLESTQKMVLPHLQFPECLIAPHHLELDPATVANLELFSSLRNGLERNHQVTTLIQIIDKTKTAMGGRLMRNWLRQPLNELAPIVQRQNLVEYFLKHPQFLSQTQATLREVIDIERLLTRIVLKQGSPKDMRALVEMLGIFSQFRNDLTQSDSVLFSRFIEAFSEELTLLHSKLDHSLLDEPAFDPRQGGIVKPGINARLDELNQVVQSSQEWIAALETSERQKTSINTLKIRYNQVFGFYIEVSKASLSLVPDYFLRKQTLVNAERFITPELKKHEEIILNAKFETDQIEYGIFLELVELIKTRIPHIQKIAASVAELDCLAGFAEAAALHQHTRPELTTDGILEITDGRHPVVEEILQHRFVSNSVSLDPDNRQLLLLTGPNMAGKSVLMRQVALITIMAHLGAFVPAKKAVISLTDRVFVRSGAADMITAGLFTFMVEMVETAQILHSSTENSLVIMDEIGRGTSTYDGISIAWAVAEALIKKTRGPKTLFATHYHELQQLADIFPKKIHNAHMAVTEQNHQPVFLYTLKDGGASHSFGLAVAKLAGIPTAVTNRASTSLLQLENGGRAQNDPDSSLNGASSPHASTANAAAQVVLEELQTLQIDHVTPIEALNTLAKWKQQVLGESRVDE